MQKMMLIALLLFTVIQSHAQSQVCTHKISGYVTDITTGNPVKDAIVYIQEIGKNTQSDEGGYYELNALCEGKYTLVCRHLNHEALSERITLTEDVRKNIVLTCHTDTLHEVSIKRAKIHWEDVTVTNTIQGQDLFLTSGLSLGKSLEKVNGVYNLSTGNTISKPMIRGMHSNRVLILNNEIRQEGQQWGNEHAPEIDQAIAKHIEVVKGAQTIRYGSDIIGGLILVNPNPLQSINKYNGEITMSTFSNGRAGSSSALMEGFMPFDSNLKWRLQGTLRKMGTSKSPDYYLGNTAMDEVNYSMAMGYHKSKWNVELFHSFFNTRIGIFSGSHIGNLTDLYAAFNAEKPFNESGFSYVIDNPYQHVSHRLVKTSLAYRSESLGLFRLLLGYQHNVRKEYDKSFKTKQDDGSYKPALNFELNTLNYDLNWEHKTWKRWNGSLGINGMYQTNNYYGFYFIPNYQKFTSGVYVVEKWHKNSFSIEAGLRYDLNQFAIQKWEQNVLITPRHAFNGWATSLAGRCQMKYFTIHANAGTAWRAPFVNELYSYGVHHSAVSFEIGDRNLNLERSYNASITLDFNYAKKLDAEVTFFTNYINDYINLQPQLPATLTIRGAFPTYRFTQVDANFYGAELSTTATIYRKVRGSFRSNVLFARDLTHGKFLVGIPPVRLQGEIDVPLIDNSRKSIHWIIEAMYTFRQNRVLDADDYVAAPPAYFLMNSDINGSFHWMKKLLNYQVGVSNIFNARYRDYLNRNRYFADELGRNLFIKLSIPFTFKNS